MKVSMGKATWVIAAVLWGTVAHAATLEMDDETVTYAEGSSSSLSQSSQSTLQSSVSADHVCGGFFASQSTLECMRIVNGARYLDEKAVNVCKGLFSADDTLKCLRAVKNRRYTQANLNLCRGFFGTKELIECLETGGEKEKKKKGFSVVQVEVPVPMPSASLSIGNDERRKVVAALRQIEAGNLKAAKRLLREYLEATE